MSREGGREEIIVGEELKNTNWTPVATDRILIRNAPVVIISTASCQIGNFQMSQVERRWRHKRKDTLWR